ncbi:MAG: hypothetical protein D6815_10005 [Candidatus Dadabacteria bacterium]|nr:MAG: hypothetical protein D6815_10005 [Candidatus Dadabacteria bacterium]
MSEDWLAELLRNFQDSITRGTFEGIYSLDGEALERVMHEQAEACVHAFVELFGIPADLDLDTFLERIQYGGSSKIQVERNGNEILWREEHHGECMCPLVKRGVIRLDEKLCVCAINWVRMLVERHARKPVQVELVDSVARGASDCTFRLKIAED